MKISLGWILFALTFPIIGFMGKEIKKLYDDNVILKNENTQLKGDDEAKQTAFDFATQQSHATFEATKSALQMKIDSLTDANNIKPDDVISATDIETSYKNSVSVNAQTETPVKLPIEEGKKQTYQVPVSFDSPCWSMKGEIVSLDPFPALTITERSSKDAIQLLVVKPKKFLGFLWRTKKQQFKAYDDCSKEINISGVKFTDQ